MINIKEAFAYHNSIKYSDSNTTKHYSIYIDNVIHHIYEKDLILEKELKNEKLKTKGIEQLLVVLLQVKQNKEKQSTVSRFNALELKSISSKDCKLAYNIRFKNLELE